MGPAAAAIEPVSLDCVDWEDRRFVIESFRPADDLRASLDRVGLLSPPWVLAAGRGKFVIVDGFKRMHCLHERGEERVPCAVLQADTNPRELWAWRLEALMFGPPLNTAERAQVIARLTDGSVEEGVVTRFLDAFHLPHRPEILGKWKRLAEADRSLLEAAAMETIHERAALELAQWPETSGDRIGLLSILQRLRCSASTQVEIIERFRDIAMGRGVPPGEILRCAEVRHILDHPDWNHREKTQATREWLDDMLFPRLKARERQFMERLRRTPPPAGTNLVPPPSFEGERWRLEVGFSNGGNLRELLAELRSWSLSAGFPALLSHEIEGGPSRSTPGRGFAMPTTPRRSDP